MKHCPRCGSADLKPYETKPPNKHNGPCLPSCWVQGFLCLACRMFHPKNT